MASIMNFGDAGSFTLAYDFELVSKVKIDGRGQETVLKKSSTIGDMYEVLPDGTECIIMVMADQLTIFEIESEAESKSRSTSKP